MHIWPAVVVVSLEEIIHVDIFINAFYIQDKFQPIKLNLKSCYFCFYILCIEEEQVKYR